ncbi:hypothetical protein [Streptomyces sp. NPDC052701]|uniref:hypothetical protein n=1 Tax=Streptomyces sp. NPDC052701 TaxID=3155533 RepID=UPI0034172A8B
MCGDGPLTCPPAPDGVLAFRRTTGALCVVNPSRAAVEPAGRTELLLATGPPDGHGRLPQDTVVQSRP